MTLINNIQNEFREIAPNSSVIPLQELLEYIESELPKFVGSHTFDKIMVKKKNEIQHSAAFSAYMMKKQDRFTFMNEFPQRGSSKVDVAVIDKITDDIFFTIEAKVLPTPKDALRSEHEYVYGKGAGIQRFKEEFHGVDYQDSPLSENGMIAYIKENDFEYWLSKVNQWILDAQWNKSEQLEKIYFKSIAKLFSKHPRPKTSDVSLYHFWIYVHLKR